METETEGNAVVSGASPPPVKKLKSAAEDPKEAVCSDSVSDDESEEFEFDYCGHAYSIITPVRNFESHKSLSNDLKCFSTKALEEYNLAEGTKYVFEKVERVSEQLVGGFIYYITFSARSSDSDESAARQTFWTQVFQPARHDYLEHLEIYFCKPKPQPPSASTSTSTPLNVPAAETFGMLMREPDVLDSPSATISAN